MSEPALRVIAGGEGAAPAPRRRGAGLLIGGAVALAGASVALEYVRATRGGGLSDLALAVVIGCSITVIVGAMRIHDSALKVWLWAGIAHVAAAVVSFAYFHLALFETHPVPLTRGQFLILQVKALVGFVAVVGLVCMIASAVRKASR